MGRARLGLVRHRSAIGKVIDRLSFQQGEPEAGHALQETLQLGLVAYVAG